MEIITVINLVIGKEEELFYVPGIINLVDDVDILWDYEVSMTFLAKFNDVDVVVKVGICFEQEDGDFREMYRYNLNFHYFYKKYALHHALPYASE